jgi:ribosomal-protein-alanine N-acetyltransferase
MSCGAGEAHILNICIDPTFRSKGIGTMLVSYLLQNARLAGVESIFLEVRPSNLSALKLYGSLGFEQVATRANYYPTTTGREDALVFNKVLAAQ